MDFTVNINGKPCFVHACSFAQTGEHGHLFVVRRKIVGIVHQSIGVILQCEVLRILEVKGMLFDSFLYRFGYDFLFQVEKHRDLYL